MRDQVSRKNAVCVGAISLCAMLAGTSAQAADVWKFGVVEAKGDAGILFMPEKFGEKYGIEIQMLEFASSTTPVKALISGQLDAFTTSPSVSLTAMSRGAKLKFIGCNWPGATYTLYGAPDVKTLADLKGKSVGISGPGSMPDLFTRVVLDKAGMKPADVVFANAGGGSDRFKSLLAGVVKATATSSEFEPEAQKRGFNILAQAHKDAPNLSRNCLVTTDKIIETRRDGLVKFLAANIDGTRYAMSHREETIALSTKVAKLAPEDTSPAFIFDEATAQKNIDPDFGIPTDKLQWIEGVLAASDSVDSNMDVKAFIDDKPRLDALKLIKP